MRWHGRQQAASSLPGNVFPNPNFTFNIKLRCSSPLCAYRGSARNQPCRELGLLLSSNVQILLFNSGFARKTPPHTHPALQVRPQPRRHLPAEPRRENPRSPSRARPPPAPPRTQTPDEAPEPVRASPGSKRGAPGSGRGPPPPHPQSPDRGSGRRLARRRRRRPPRGRRGNPCSAPGERETRSGRPALSCSAPRRIPPCRSTGRSPASPRRAPPPPRRAARPGASLHTHKMAAAARPP